MRVDLETSLGTVTFRVPTLKDLWVVRRALPLLAQPGEGGEDATARPKPGDVETALAAVGVADRLLVRCAVTPHLASSDPEAPPGMQLNGAGGVLDLEEMEPDERTKLAEQLMARRRGLRPQEAADLAPLPRTSTGSP